MQMFRARARTLFLSSCLALAGGAGCVAAPPDDATDVTDDATDNTAGEALAESTAEASLATWKVLDVQYQVQATGYWCGPASTRIALSARRSPPSQQSLATQLGTTTNGTDWIGQVTGVLNQNLGTGWYRTQEMPNDPPSQAQKDRLWRDIVAGVENNYPLVANIVAPPGNQPPGYPSNQTIYHYFTIIGYNPATRQVYIADPANFGGNSQYWLSFDQLASLVPPKGYSAYRCGTGLTVGAIAAKYQAIGGCGSILGAPTSDEITAPDGAGRYNVFERGSIYWSPATGAHEVHGLIRDRWAAVGWETGQLGYPTSDEVATPDGVGRYNVFERGSIYWSPSTGAHEVYGAIRDAWAARGWEAGALGYPTSGEYAVSGGRRNDFQRGSITWTAATQQITVVVNP